jgi:hypothetical protein
MIASSRDQSVGEIKSAVCMLKTRTPESICLAQSTRAAFAHRVWKERMVGLKAHHIRSLDGTDTVGLKTHPMPQTCETCALTKVNKNRISIHINSLPMVSRVKPS